MSEDLTPSIEIKPLSYGGEEYYVIAYDGVRFDDCRMPEEGAIWVHRFLQHAIERGWELGVLYKPEG